MIIPGWLHLAWSTWSDWSICSAPCNSSVGNQTRSRHCMNAITNFYIPDKECLEMFPGEIKLELISCGAGDCIEGDIKNTFYS